MSMKACSHPGMVRGSTKMLLARVRGNRTRRLALETALGVRRNQADNDPDPRQGEGERQDERHRRQRAAHAVGRNPRARLSAIDLHP